MTADAYYELRIYETVQSRLPGLAELMADDAPPVFSRLGFEVLTNFQGAGGPFGPIYGYVLRWPDLDTRMRCWDSFYTDPEWRAIYAARFGDGGRVERQNISILRAAPVWGRFRGTADDPVGGIYELRRHDLAGQGHEVAARQVGDQLADMQRAGGMVLGVFDSILGEPGPRTVSLTAWADMAALTAFRSGDAPAGPPHDAFFLRPVRGGAARADLSPHP